MTFWIMYQASNVMIGYGGKEHTLVYDIMICDYDRVKEHLEKGEELNWIVDSAVNYRY